MIMIIVQDHHPTQAPLNRGDNGFAHRGRPGNDRLDPTMRVFGIEDFGNQDL